MCTWMFTVTRLVHQAELNFLSAVPDPSFRGLGFRGLGFRGSGVRASGITGLGVGRPAPARESKRGWG